VPPPATNLVLWLEADVGLFKDTAGTTPATADGDLVALWKDQSGLVNDVIQATSGNRPVLKLAILNGKPVLRFVRASSQSMATTGSVAHGIGTGDFWFAAVYALSTGAGTSFNTIFSNGSCAPAFYLPVANVGSAEGFYLGIDHLFTTTLAASTAFLTEMGRISGTVKAWNSSGGAAPALDATTFAIATSIANASLFVGNDNSGGFFTGDIAELFLYKASLNSTDQTSLENYLRNKYWGVSFGPPPSDNIYGGFRAMTGGFVDG
jgi:hypothetical protein